MKKLKTVDIKGKEYVLVVDRVIHFNDIHPNGSIRTNRLTTDRGYEVVQAIVIPDVKNSDRYFTGLSQADISQGMVNKQAALENAETSAVGRALGMMGIGVVDSIASVDELTKVGAYSTPKTPPISSLGLRHCDEHNVDVEIQTSKSTGKPYAMCRAGKTTHFVNSPEEKAGFQDKTNDAGQDNIW